MTSNNKVEALKTENKQLKRQLAELQAKYEELLDTYNWMNQGMELEGVST